MNSGRWTVRFDTATEVNSLPSSPPQPTVSPPFSHLGITVLERGWLSSNNIVVVGTDHAAVIDTGYSSHAAQTVGLVKAALGDRSLDVIANTHLHSDHCGGNAALQAFYPRARILIPPGQAEAVRHWDANSLTFEPTGQQCARFGFDDLLVPGETIRLGDVDWEVHAARGHDPHSVVLFEPSHRVLISADALWANGFGIVFPELDDEEGFDDVDATLRLIQGLDPAWVIPGHGAVFADVSGAMTRARSRLAQFVERPDKHRRHALKVLIKFKLLEWQQTTFGQLSAWFAASAYFIRIARKDSADDLDTVLNQLLRELAAVGALSLEANTVRNA